MSDGYEIFTLLVKSANSAKIKPPPNIGIIQYLKNNLYLKICQRQLGIWRSKMQFYLEMCSEFDLFVFYHIVLIVMLDFKNSIWAVHLY